LLAVMKPETAYTLYNYSAINKIYSRKKDLLKFIVENRMTI